MCIKKRSIMFSCAIKLYCSTSIQIETHFCTFSTPRVININSIGEKTVSVNYLPIFWNSFHFDMPIFVAFFKREKHLATLQLILHDENITMAGKYFSNWLSTSYTNGLSECILMTYLCKYKKWKISIRTGWDIEAYLTGVWRIYVKINTSIGCDVDKKGKIYSQSDCLTAHIYIVGIQSL